MRVKFLRHYKQYRPGEVHDVEDFVAQQLFEAKKAMRVKDFRDEDATAKKRGVMPRRVTGRGLVHPSDADGIF